MDRYPAQTERRGNRWGVELVGRCCRVLEILESKRRLLKTAEDTIVTKDTIGVLARYGDTGELQENC